MSDHDAGAVAGLLLVRTIARGRSKPIAGGDELVARARADAEPGSPVRRTAVPA